MVAPIPRFVDLLPHQHGLAFFVLVDTHCMDFALGVSSTSRAQSNPFPHQARRVVTLQTEELLEVTHSLQC